MVRSDGVTRRKALKLAGATTSAAVLAGCGGNEGGGNGDGGGGNGGGIQIEPGTQIEFNGITGGWEGIAPSSIEGESNPTLALQEGETYEIGWTEGDGANHNIAIYDDSDSVVNDLQTEIVSDPGENQWLEFEASSAMVTYICEVHPSSMVGDIVMQ